VEAVENLRSKVLKKALQQVRPKSIRAAWAWKKRDKVSSAWLLATPGRDTSLSSAEFSEAAASNLCLPSLACRGRVGEVIRGQVKVDLGLHRCLVFDLESVYRAPLAGSESGSEVPGQA
jgi:hypothetical protein